MNRKHFVVIVASVASAALVLCIVALSFSTDGEVASSPPDAGRGRGGGFHNEAGTAGDVDRVAIKTASAKDPNLTEPKYVADKMRRDGYPDHVIYQAVSMAIKLKNREERMRITGVERLPRWQSSFRLSARAAAELKALEAAEDAELRRLTNISIFVAQETASIDRKKYGDLSSDKIDALRQIEKDYKEMMMRSGASAGDGSPGSTLKARLLVKDEVEKDIRNILTADEASDYFRYNSDVAKVLQAQLGALNIDDYAYAKLADAALAAERAARPFLLETRAVARKATDLFRTYRDVLGDQDFVRIIKDIDPMAASADAIYQDAKMDIGTRADLFFVGREVTASFQNGVSMLPSNEASRIFGALTSTGLTPAQIRAFEATRMGALLRQAMRSN